MNANDPRLSPSDHALVRAHAALTLTTERAPLEWVDALRWWNAHGYRLPLGDEATPPSRFLDDLVDRPAGVRWFRDLCLAIALLHFERHERRRRLQQLPRPTQSAVMLRFEELRMLGRPPDLLAQWATTVLGRVRGELRLDSRLADFAFLIGAYAPDYAAHLRYLMVKERVSEEQTMRFFWPLPCSAHEWLDQAVTQYLSVGPDAVLPVADAVSKQTP